MTRTKSTYLALLAVLLSPMAANADPINFDEAIDGDIAISDEFTFDFGLNVISGNASCLLDSECDFDIFDVILPTNSVLQSVSLSLTNADNGNGLFAFSFHMFDQDSNEILQESVSSGGDFFWLIEQQFAGLEFTGLNSFPSGMSNNYTVTFDVTSVPEPGTLALLGIGLLGMGAARRRKKA